MKKNIAMRLASGLMLSCLLSTCVISGTFAKYTTDATSTDTARVAAWGVTITATNESAFATTYVKDDDDFTLDANTVVSTGNVVAPGTKGDLAALDVSGTPEVAVRVTYDAELTLNGWTVDAADYCPIVFIVNGTEFKSVNNVSELVLQVVAAIENTSTDYKAGTDLSTVEDDLKVSWKWDFEGNDNTKDTVLGNAGTKAEIELTIKTTISQID